jgi:small subunit ribosomal protein S16
MVLRIRLARFGRRHSPIYNIVVAQARSARNSKPLEVIGIYDPQPKIPLSSNSDPETMLDRDGSEVPFVARRIKDIQLDQLRTKYWLGVGAQPTETVERLLCLVSVP